MYENIRIRPFEKLCERHEWHKYSDASTELIQRFSGTLPDFILAIWERYGLTCHADGEVWFTNPDDFTDVVRAFFGEKYPFLIFARHSFGYLHAILGNRLYIIHPQIARAKDMGSVELVEIQIKDIIYSDGRHKDHISALKKLGPINEDQMYGYVPMLALGGDGSLKETRIVQMHEYLLLVADAATDAVRSGWNPLGLPTE